jgi:hypothetical protein
MWHITSQKYGANALGLQRILVLGSYQGAVEPSPLDYYLDEYTFRLNGALQDHGGNFSIA